LFAIFSLIGKTSQIRKLWKSIISAHQIFFTEIIYNQVMIHNIICFSKVFVLKWNDFSKLFILFSFYQSSKRFKLQLNRNTIIYSNRIFKIFRALLKTDFVATPPEMSNVRPRAKGGNYFIITMFGRKEDVDERRYRYTDKSNEPNDLQYNFPLLVTTTLWLLCSVVSYLLLLYRHLR